MVTAVRAAKSIPSYFHPPKAFIRFRLLRDGEPAAGEKFLRIYRSWEEIEQLDLVFWAPPGDGEYSLFQAVDLATLQAVEWLGVGRDDALPRRVRAAYLNFTAGGTYTFNITSGDSGQAGDPARVDARVRVERVPSNREIVLLERPPDGEWRIAGYGPTPSGVGDIDLRVVGGDVYAMAVDDYGVQFSPAQVVQVGQRIRPAQYTGWLYQITEAGALPSTEPEWWAAQGENPSRPLGTARAIAVRYYRPLAHGPIPVEVI